MARKKHAKGNQVNTQTVTERAMGEKEEKRETFQVTEMQLSIYDT